MAGMDVDQNRRGYEQSTALSLAKLFYSPRDRRDQHLPVDLCESRFHHAERFSQRGVAASLHRPQSSQRIGLSRQCFFSTASGTELWTMDFFDSLWQPLAIPRCDSSRELVHGGFQ